MKLIKKITSLALIMLFITACGGSKKEEFYLTYNNKDIKLDTVYDQRIHGNPNDSFESTNCAFGDRDVTFIYDDIEIETYGNKKNELIIYSIVLTGDNIKTTEGIGLYDSMNDAIKIYGEDYAQNDNQYTYNHGKTSLVFITDNGLIESIEYKLNNLN